MYIIYRNKFISRKFTTQHFWNHNNFKLISTYLLPLFYIERKSKLYFFSYNNRYCLL